MPRWLHKPTKDVLRSVASADLPNPVTEYIEEPDLTAVSSVPPKYWVINVDDTITEMAQAEKDAVDQAILDAQRDSVVTEIDELESIFRAFVLALLDERNRMAQKFNALKNGIVNANNLSDAKSAVSGIANEPIRTASDIKTGIRNKLGS